MVAKYIIDTPWGESTGVIKHEIEELSISAGHREMRFKVCEWPKSELERLAWIEWQGSGVLLQLQAKLGEGKAVGCMEAGLIGLSIVLDPPTFEEAEQDIEKQTMKAKDAFKNGIEANVLPEKDVLKVYTERMAEIEKLKTEIELMKTKGDK